MTRRVSAGIVSQREFRAARVSSIEDERSFRATVWLAWGGRQKPRKPTALPARDPDAAGGCLKFHHPHALSPAFINPFPRPSPSHLAVGR